MAMYFRQLLRAACLVGFFSGVQALDAATTQPATRPTTQARQPATTRATIARRPTTAPTTQRNAQTNERGGEKPGEKDLAPELKPAIAALAAEMEQALKQPDSTAVRTMSDYFANKEINVAPRALLDAIIRPLHRDPRVDAYIKWQLLSAQKSAFSGNDAAQALQIYLNCPPPPARPGTSAIDQKRLTAEIAQAKAGDVEPYNAQWDRNLRANDLQFAPLLGLRDALYAQIPKNFDVLKSALIDADQRLQNGYDAKAFIKTVFADIRTWAVQANKQEVGKMSDLVQACASREATKRFTEISFSDKTSKATWRSTSIRFDKKQCDTLAADLRQIANAAF